ncbi:unnamed protein product [Owenia fusiformis]|uniref:Uncharacterized protein n=1 Tax=Owenia fusiformis TaxID=6347 RepID=A0A8J1Y026_OWEFU|nr:unnamed protein product [Owenia fusiformis]
MMLFSFIVSLCYPVIVAYRTMAPVDTDDLLPNILTKTDDVDTVCGPLLDKGDQRCNGTNPSTRWYFIKAPVIRHYPEFTLVPQCRPFTYTGCGGNSNNFPSRLACQRRCAKHVCTSLPDKHKCKATGKLPDHIYGDVFYNSKVGKCRKIGVSKCTTTAHANLFESLDECNGVCHVCTLKPVLGSCNHTFMGDKFDTRKALREYWYFDTVELSCKRSLDNRCLLNANSFNTEDNCLKKCVNKKVCYKDGSVYAHGEGYEDGDEICTCARVGRTLKAYNSLGKIFCQNKANGSP